MKKTLRKFAFTTFVLLSLSASAQGIDDLMRPEKWHGDGNAPVSYGEKIRFNEGMPTKQELDISVGSSGIYDIAIECNANSVSSKCMIYAKGTNYSVCSAEVPLARGQKNVKVYLRGVGTTDGKVKIGIERMRQTLKSLMVCSSTPFAQSISMTALSAATRVL